ncbi:MAG: nicotinamide riboside transporter PnuC [Armatimonadota bacterium]
MIRKLVWALRRFFLLALRKPVWALLWFVSMALITGSWRGWVPIGMIEVLGFITGAVCVLLVVEQNIWTFPVGIANNIFFIILFLTARLYGDMTLQFIYIALAFHGWYQWLWGGANRTNLQVSRAPWWEWAWLAPAAVGATAGLTFYFIRIHDAAPFLDAVTTVLSLAAQYLLNRKRLENWLVWITADVIYIGLYIQRELYLTAMLYAIFIFMCIAGILSWRKAIQRGTEEPVPATAGGAV